MQPGTVLVLGDFPQTLAVVRSLGRAGYRVILGTEKDASIAERSRHCHGVWRYGPINAASFSESLLCLVRSLTDLRCIFPIGESIVQRLHCSPELSNQCVPIAAVPRSLFHACRDKSWANRLAAEAGIAVPKFRVVRDGKELRAAAAVIGFPLIIKTVRSEAKVFGRKAYIVNDQQEFDSRFGAWPQPHAELLVQAYIAGTLASCDFVAVDGRILAYYESAMVRSDMPDGTGFAVEFESLPPSVPLLEVLQAFVETHGYTGPGLLQCVACAESGKHYFIEVNPRLSAGVAESVAAGLDVPLLTLHAATGEAKLATDTRAVAEYRVGHRSYWLERDLQGWLNCRDSLSLGARAAWLGRMLMGLCRADGHINWQWQDPLPSLWIFGRLGGRVVSKLVTKFRATR